MCVDYTPRPLAVNFGGSIALSDRGGYGTGRGDKWYDEGFDCVQKLIVKLAEIFNSFEKVVIGLHRRPHRLGSPDRKEEVE